MWQVSHSQKQSFIRSIKNITLSENTKEKSAFIINLSGWSNIQMCREKMTSLLAHWERYLKITGQNRIAFTSTGDKY
jgi:hypothetical protein